jgi:hypothetical protein
MAFAHPDPTFWPKLLVNLTIAETICETHPGATFDMMPQIGFNTYKDAMRLGVESDSPPCSSKRLTMLREMQTGFSGLIKVRSESACSVAKTIAKAFFGMWESIANFKLW